MSGTAERSSNLLRRRKWVPILIWRRFWPDLQRGSPDSVAILLKFKLFFALRSRAGGAAGVRGGCRPASCCVFVSTSLRRATVHPLGFNREGLLLFTLRSLCPVLYTFQESTTLVNRKNIIWCNNLGFLTRMSPPILIVTNLHGCTIFHTVTKSSKTSPRTERGLFRKCEDNLIDNNLKRFRPYFF